MIRGEIQTLPLSDLICWLAQTRRTGQLVISQGDQRFEFAFDAGEIADASSPEVVPNEPAINAREVLASALQNGSGTFAFVEGPPSRKTLETGFRYPALALLLDVLPNRGEPERDTDNPIDESHTQLQKQSSSRPNLFPIFDQLKLRVMERLLTGEFYVPPMPLLTSKVLELTSTEDYSLRDLGELVSTDQSVAAQVLRYANSVTYGGSRKIDTLPVAVQRLGSEEVVNVVLATTILARKRGPDMFAKQRRSLWMHSSAAAILSRSLSARVGLRQNLGFLCGLLTDFGMNVLYSIIEDVLKQQPATPGVVDKIVQDYHPLVGRVVGESWQLPQEAIESMAYHHCLGVAAVEHKYVALSALADFLASLALSHPRNELERALSEFPLDNLIDHPAARIIGLGQYEAARALTLLPTHVDQAARLIAD